MDKNYDEKGKVHMVGHLIIRDKDTKEEFVNQRDITPKPKKTENEK